MSLSVCQAEDHSKRVIGSRRSRAIPLARQEWCERGELNPHPLRDWILSPARLPVPPLSQKSDSGAPTRAFPNSPHRKPCGKSLRGNSRQIADQAGNLAKPPNDVNHTSPRNRLSGLIGGELSHTDPQNPVTQPCSCPEGSRSRLPGAIGPAASRPARRHRRPATSSWDTRSD